MSLEGPRNFADFAPAFKRGREEKSKLPEFGIESNRHIGWGESVVRPMNFQFGQKRFLLRVDGIATHWNGWGN
jgi:hypothetical protein